MIYPTSRAVALTALGALIVLPVGFASASSWWIGPAWIGVMLALILVDAIGGAWPGRAAVSLTAPTLAPSGGRADIGLDVHFPRGGAPRSVEGTIDADPLVRLSPTRALCAVRARSGRLSFDMQTVRRGEARLRRFWLRWRGPLGLLWKQQARDLDNTIAIVPDTLAVKDEAIRLFSRTALHGLKPQKDRSDGSEFDALTEYMPGMDRRAIDWKHSARHHKLLAKEYQADRNDHIVFAIDAGRLMCEPLAGQPRIDRALNAALMLAYVGLRMGDRVGMFVFDSKPRLMTPTVAGTAAFRILQRLTASVDYSSEETNFTLALSELAGALKRRSLIVVFTDFVDTTSAELMIENLGRLLKRHHVLFVAFRDAELEAMRASEPATADDVSRAVIANALLKERTLVVSRLQRLGADILDPPLERLGVALLNAYLAIKRRRAV
jgi:uncharacterized protein (DUF58 family)